jgi:hypothetical protein
VETVYFPDIIKTTIPADFSKTHTPFDAAAGGSSVTGDDKGREK